MLAPTGGKRYSQTCWQQNLRVTLVSLPSAGKYWLCSLSVSASTLAVQVFFFLFWFQFERKLCNFPKLQLLWYIYILSRMHAVIGLQHRWLVTVNPQTMINYHQIRWSKSDKWIRNDHRAIMSQDIWWYATTEISWANWCKEKLKLINKVDKLSCLKKIHVQFQASVGRFVIAKQPWRWRMVLPYTVIVKVPLIYILFTMYIKTTKLQDWQTAHTYYL